MPTFNLDRSISKIVMDIVRLKQKTGTCSLCSKKGFVFALEGSSDSDGAAEYAKVCELHLATQIDTFKQCGWSNIKVF